MHRHPSHSQPPGEDTLDIPQSLGWFVAACTWVRHLVLAVGDTLGPPSPRRRRTGPALAADPG